MTDSLSDKMRALAASHPCGAELKAKADEFDEKTKAHYSAGAEIWTDWAGRYEHAKPEDWPKDWRTSTPPFEIGANW